MKPMTETSAYYPIPTVIEKTGRGERVYDIYSRLLEDRIVFIGTQIDDQVANAVMAQLLFLDKTGRNQDIKMYINSPGGSVTAGLAIYDTMRFVRNEIATMCIGQAASMAAVLLCAGTKGKRMALPNARVLIHQPLGGTSGQASEIEIAAREILRMKQLLNQILSSNCGKPPEQVEKDSDRDFIMTAAQALDYGLIDKVFESRKKKPGPTT